VTLSYDGKRETAPLTAGTQDRLSQMYQFMFVAMPVTQLVFDSTNGRMVENYRYALIGKEPTKTSLGNIPALRFTKDQVAGQDKTDIWLAVSRKNFPVRIQQADKEGGKLEQVLTALSL
jgi:hypothetical protein